MALIKQIRQRTGLAIGVIAGGLILFRSEQVEYLQKQRWCLYVSKHGKP